MLLTAAGGFFLELLAREQSSAQGLSDRHRELLGLEAVRDIEERSWRGGEGQAVTPDGRDLFTVRAGVEGDARRPAQPAVPARDEQVHPVGDVVAEVQQREGALVGEQCIAGTHGHPRLAQVVVFGGWESSDAVQTAADTREAPAAHVVIQELAADSMRTGLAGSEVAALLISLGLELPHARVYVIHKTSIA